MKPIQLALLIVCACFFVTLGYAGDKKISKKQIPDAVMKSFTEQYPNAIIKGQAIEKEKGKTYFEIESVDGKTNRDLLYTSDGKVSEIEESMDPGALSDTMKSTISKEYPKGKIAKAERVTHGEMVGYEIQVKVGKKTHEVKFDAQGIMVKASKKNKESDEDEENGEEEEDN